MAAPHPGARVYHQWAANETILLSVIKCYTNATWKQACIIINERYPGAFVPTLSANQAQEKFKDMRRRGCPHFDEVRGYGLATATQRFPLANWVDRGQSNDPRGLKNLVIYDRRADRCCRFLPASGAPRAQPAAGARNRPAGAPGNPAAASSEADGSRGSSEPHSNEAEFGSAEGDDQYSDDLSDDDEDLDDEDLDASGEEDDDAEGQDVDAEGEDDF